MKTTPADRAAWRAELTREHPDMCAGDATMALGVLDDLAECETRCEHLRVALRANLTLIEALPRAIAVSGLSAVVVDALRAIHTVTLAGLAKCEATAEPVVWAHEDAPFTGAQVRDLLAENAKLRAENDANATWLNETWPTIADRELGELVRERDEALAKVAALTQERDMLRTALGYWHGVRLDRVVRDRDENAAIASAAMTAGLAECERLRGEIESLADSLGDTRAHAEG